MKQDFEKGMRAQLERWREALAGGDGRAGWKTALSTGPLREQLGLEGTAVGHLLTSRCEEPGARHSLAGGTRVLAEPELAIHIGGELTAGADRDAAERAIAGLGPSLEIVDLAAPPRDLETVLATNIFQRAACFAPLVGRGASLDGVAATVVKNGEAQGPIDPAAVTGDPVDIVLGVIETLGAFGERLLPGDRILAGSLIPPLPVEPGDRVELELSGLGRVALDFGE